jgi:hypothetical protein
MIGGAAWCEPHVPSLTVGVATYWPGRTLKTLGTFHFVVVEFPNIGVRSLTVAAQFRPGLLSRAVVLDGPITATLFSSLRVSTQAFMPRYVLLRPIKSC